MADLDPFQPVYYTGQGDTSHWHTVRDCKRSNRAKNTGKVRVSRLASMLASGKQACEVCTNHLDLSPDAIRHCLRTLTTAPTHRLPPPAAGAAPETPT